MKYLSASKLLQKFGFQCPRTQAHHYQVLQCIVVITDRDIAAARTKYQFQRVIMDRMEAAKNQLYNQMNLDIEKVRSNRKIKITPGKTWEIEE